MKNKKIILLIVILGIAVVGTVTFFIFRPRHQELFPQQFAKMPEKPSLIAEFHHGPIIRSVAFSPADPFLIAFGDQYDAIKLWNRNNTKEPVKRNSHPGMFVHIGFSPTGELLASASHGKLVLWDVASWMKINTLESSSNFAFTPDGNQLATVYNEVKIWDIRNPKQITEVATLPFDEAHKARGWAITVGISSDGKWIAAGYSDGTINVWDLKTKQLVKTLETPFYRRGFLKFSPDDKFLAAGGPVLYMDDNKQKGGSSGSKGYSMWELPSWKRHGEVQRGNIDNLVFSPDGKICASANDQSFSGRGVELWSVKSGAPITFLPTQARDVSFSHDGKMLAAGGWDGIIQLWELTPQQLEAATPLTDLVHIIYYLPKDKEPSPNITEKLDKLIREVQDFYADEMERHGFGRKTFTFETDENGKAKIYLVKYNQTNIDLSNDIWLLFVEDTLMHFESIPELSYAGPIHTFKYATPERGTDKDNVLGRALEGIPPGRSVSIYVNHLNRKSIAYILRPVFNLPYIDYKPNILKRLFSRVNDKMPWGKKWAKLSRCEAEWLDRSRFFNPNQPFFDKAPKMDMRVSVPKISGLRHFIFEVADEDGMHQVQLFVPRDVKDQWRGEKFYDCQGLNGKDKATVVFEISDPEIKSVKLRMIDMHGNIASRLFKIKEKTPEPSE